MTEELHFAPDVPGTIASARARYFEWVQILGELIDNAFDAGSNRVEIVLNGRELSFDDDGDGCDDLEKMLTMGRHSRKATTRLGRYGVGLKDAAWWVGGPTFIETCHAGRLRAILLEWDHMTRWAAPMPSIVPSDGRRGTLIRFRQMSKDRRFPDGKRLNDVLADLGFKYSPAIKQGKQIIFRRGRSEPVLIQRYELPTLTDKIETTISVDGKTARICAGIVPDGVDNPRPGLIYTHAFRVITHGALGCGGLGSARIAGWVALDTGWTLARNKDDITAYKDELGDAVFAAIRPIVEKASGRALTLKITSLSTDLTSMFRSAMGAEDAKAKREKPTNRGARAKPTDTGGKHKQAKRTQPGSRFRDVRAGKFRVDFRPCADGAIGDVDLDGRCIWLADNHPWVMQDKTDGNRRALLQLAVTLFGFRDCDSPTPMLPSFRDGSTARKGEIAVGHLLSELHEDNATPEGRRVTTLQAVP